MILAFMLERMRNARDRTLSILDRLSEFSELRIHDAVETADSRTYAADCVQRVVVCYVL